MESLPTIAALATAHGPGALAVIRVSGEQATQIVGSCVKNKEALICAEDRQTVLCRFIGCRNREAVDQVTVVKYSAPRSYTGENMVEIICHGSMILVEKILENLIDAGAQYASKGDFTRRAFMNGKIDLIRAEAIGQIGRNASVAQVETAVHNYFGGYQQSLVFWRNQVEQLQADIESWIDFGDEDDVAGSNVEDRIGERIARLKEQIEREIRIRDKICECDHGARIAFVGPPNAGKSTILNLVLGYERSIVFPEEGTTRDAVSERVSWHGFEVTFIDCAGLRKTEKTVERLGVDRSWAIVDNSDVVVLVSSADRKETEEEKEALKRKAQQGKMLGIINKIDLQAPDGKKGFFKKNKLPYICISAIDPGFREKVIDFILDSVMEFKKHMESRSIITTKRQEKIAKDMTKHLEEMQKLTIGQGELLAVHARHMRECMDDFVGKSTPEDILNEIFSEFCIGK
jgi:tRNA modification GTPase